MRYILLGVIFVLIAFSVLNSETAALQEQEIREQLQKFEKAYGQFDVDILEKLIADDYIHTNLDGSVLNKTQWIERQKMRQGEMKAGKIRIDAYRHDDVKIRIYGNTAVVTGQALSAGVREGKDFNLNLRFTNVWVENESGWQRVAFHDSAVSSK